MEAKTIQERIRMGGRQRLPWDSSMSLDDMERACAVIDAVAAEFDNDLAYNPATHVVVSREAAETVFIPIVENTWYTMAYPEKRRQNALAELRAAMEGK